MRCEKAAEKQQGRREQKRRPVEQLSVLPDRPIAQLQGQERRDEGVCRDCGANSARHSGGSPPAPQYHRRHSAHHESGSDRQKSNAEPGQPAALERELDRVNRQILETRKTIAQIENKIVALQSLRVKAA